MVLREARDYVRMAYDVMVATVDTREIGKTLAIPSEYWQRDWINDNTDLDVDRREDAEDCDGNQSGYDLCSTRGLRIQAKFRSSILHLENTRRNSKKNLGAASTSGHVAYSLGECDVFCFTRPNGEYNTTDKWEILAIPAAELEDPKKIEKEWIGRAKEVLESLEARQ